MNLGKSYEDMTAEERAIFTSHLMYEPHRERLNPEPTSMTAEQFREEWKSLQAREDWIADAEEWLERESIRKTNEADHKNRRVWGKIK